MEDHEDCIIRRSLWAVLMQIEFAEIGNTGNENHLVDGKDGANLPPSATRSAYTADPLVRTSLLPPRVQAILVEKDATGMVTPSELSELNYGNQFPLALSRSDLPGI